MSDKPKHDGENTGSRKLTLKTGYWILYFKNKSCYCIRRNIGEKIVILMVTHLSLIYRSSQLNFLITIGTLSL